MRKSYKFRLYPKRNQIPDLDCVLKLCCNLYNSALSERKLAYKQKMHYLIDTPNITCTKQSREIKIITKELPNYHLVYSQVLHNVIKRIDLAFKAFFERCKLRDGKAGYPRFKSNKRYDSFTYPQANNGSVKLDGNKITLSKLGTFKFKKHTEILGDVKTATILQSGNKWYIILSCDNVPTNIVCGRGAIGIDLGVENLVTLSDGTLIDNPSYGERELEKLANAQRRLSTKKKGSKNYDRSRIDVNKTYAKIVNQRKYNDYKIARSIIEKYDTIVIEKLNLRSMMEKGSKSLHRRLVDASLGSFIRILKHKAEEAGARVIEVNPRDTSQLCSNCGVKVPKELGQRQHRCPNCGLDIHRDINAAINILNKARLEPSQLEIVARST